MITLENYKDKSTGLPFNTMPAALQDGHRYMNDFGDLYNDDPEIKEVIDLYLVELNKWLANLKPAPPKKDFLKEHVIVARMPKAENKKADCGCTDKKHEEKCDNCKEDKKGEAKLKRDDENSAGVPQNILDVFRSTKKDAKGFYIPSTSNSDKYIINKFKEAGIKVEIFNHVNDTSDLYDVYFKVVEPVAKKAVTKLPKTERNKKKVEEKKSKRETKAEVKTRHTNAEQFIKDIEAAPAKLKAMSEGQLIAIGLEFHKTFRTAAAQTRDGKHDSVKRLSPTPENLLRWMKNPGHFDLIGVDTFERIDPTADYKKEISKQKFWNKLGIKI